MNCKKVSQSLLSYLDNEVSPQDRESIEAHLSACPGCRGEMEALAETQRELRQALESMTAGASPSPYAWATIEQRLAAEEQHGAGILNRGIAKLKDGIGMLKSRRPVWRPALVTILSVALIFGLCLTIVLLRQPSGAMELTKFSSYSELTSFLKANPDAYRYDSLGSWGAGALEAADDKFNSASSAQDYSTTNIQVEGVDEADIIKTDGEFIYLVSGTSVIIARAYPVDEAQVLAEIKLDERVDGIFINGHRLVVMHQNWNDWVVHYESYEKQALPEPAELLVPQTYIKVYDISDIENPVLVRDMSVDGDYFGSRMVGDYVYVIVNASAYEQDGEVELPVIHLVGSPDVKVDATDIYYIDIADYYYNFTTIATVNVKEDDQKPKYETILLGANSNLYVSLNNIYITSTVWSKNSETTIHRIRTSGGEIAYEANGEVPGRVLNQFSMDEYQGFLRIATTTTANHLYILNMNLEIVGSLEDLAPGEQIYSARFMGDRGYIVTFKQVDPLFVIDLTNPFDPKNLGYLKITGYSDYLHPYDENHLIGIGKEATSTGLFQGVKISLFNVSDVDNPMEIAKYEIGDRGTESPVLTDHKALLFDRARNLMVMPVLVMEGGKYVRQGAYVFHISPEEGLRLKGIVTHCEDENDLQGSYYSPGDSWVQRSLYIDNVLYTISNTKIGMNDLDNLNEIGEIQLP